MSPFETFWKIYPHYQARSKKAMSKAIWQAVTTVGHEATVTMDGGRLKLDLRATPEEIIIGAKAYYMTMETFEYSAGCQVWLNQGRWMDFDDAEEQAERYDMMKENVRRMIEKKKGEGNIHRLS